MVIQMIMVMTAMGKMTTMGRMINVVAHVVRMVRFTEHSVDLQMRKGLS